MRSPCRKRKMSTAKRRLDTLVARSALTLSLLLAAAHAQLSIQAGRLSDTPLLKPGSSWTAHGVFNPAAVRVGGKTILLFRATDANDVSSIGYAESDDGIHFRSDPNPVLKAETGYEKPGGVEDPRVVRIEGTYYLTYTGYNRKDAQLCMAASHDLKHWERKGVILPAYKGTWNKQWTKSGAIVPQKINGKWWMYYLGTSDAPDGVTRDKMGLAVSTDLIHWTDATAEPVLDVHPHAFDSRVMEPGPPPLVTSRGILLLYNGADDKLVYRPAWALFDLHDPTHLIARAQEPFLEPKLQWERVGAVPNVIFLEGAVPRPGSNSENIDLTGYYGAADRYIGAARIQIGIKP